MMPGPNPSAAAGFDAVLLDLDGTLVESHHGILGSLHVAMAEMGYPLAPDRDLTWMIGPPLHDSIASLLAEHGDDRVDEAVRLYRRHYEDGGLLNSPLFPHIRDTLQALHDDGRRLFLATSKPLHSARRILDLHGLVPLFTGLYGARPDDSGAEKPELIAGLIEKEGVDPARAVMVGDRRFDVFGAHANRMRVLGVLWGYGSAEEFAQAGADGVVERPEDLRAAVDAQLAAAQAHA